MELTPMSVVLSDSYVLVSCESVKNFKKTVKKHLLSVGKFLIQICPVYPMCVMKSV
ncbi:MAG: hypothetical protein J6X23_00350 [Bacteroidaceae bacterium]|nr:hypothetical protein [Bacteroidaceae bacterium]MBQ6049105.1 hypothetical protein [Bacteroidaceae bacterium]